MNSDFIYFLRLLIFLWWKVCILWWKYFCISFSVWPVQLHHFFLFYHHILNTGYVSLVSIFMCHANQKVLFSFEKHKDWARPCKISKNVSKYSHWNFNTLLKSGLSLGIYAEVRARNVFLSLLKCTGCIISEI